MPLVGVVCNQDGSFQSFEHCIACHEFRNKDDPTRICHAPTATLKSMRDNAKHRSGAGVSASTLLSCPRAVAIQEKYEFYETPISGWNKHRGTLIHAMFEEDTDPPVGMLREKRLYYELPIKDSYEDLSDEGVLGSLRVSGQFDQFDSVRGVLVDYKSKDKLPKERDQRHEAQFNIYAFLLRLGTFKDTGEDPEWDGKPARFTVNAIGAHYVTFKTKAEEAWLKMSYPVWGIEETFAFIAQRARPLFDWQQTGILPACNPYAHNPRWKCDCEKLELQLAERGVHVT